MRRFLRNLALKIYNTRDVCYKFSALSYVNSVSPNTDFISSAESAEAAFGERAISAIVSFYLYRSLDVKQE